MFVELEEHPTDVKQDFTVGTFTLLKSNLAQTPIFTAQCKLIINEVKFINSTINVLL